MKFAISPLVRQVHFPPISEVREWIAGLEFPPERPLIDLCQAVPDYPPAPELVDHLAGCLADPATSRYTPDEGLPEVRQVVAERYGRVYGACITPDRLCLTIGASQAFWLAMVTLCRSGDEVIVQTPYYFDHDMVLAMLGIKRVYAPFDQASGGMPSIDAVAGLITARTRAILLVTPSNPTGTVAPPHLLAELYQLAAKQRIPLL
ncbi:MAG TPA: aminotransferase class I/II-fold pyridoxal phosphate-dependent enzyme, partial [Geobacteraceae bacterium]